MSFKRIPTLALLALALLLLASPQAPIFAQSINCVISKECVDPEDRPVLTFLRTVCRDNASAATWRIGGFLPKDQISDGGGPPLAPWDVCEDLEPPDPPDCIEPHVIYSCVGLKKTSKLIR